LLIINLMKLRQKKIKGIFFEIPISTYKINIIERLYQILVKKFKNNEFDLIGDGVGLPTYKKNKFKDYVQLLCSYKKTVMFSIDERIFSLFVFKKVKNSINDIIYY